MQECASWGQNIGGPLMPQSRLKEVRPLAELYAGVEFSPEPQDEAGG